MHSVDGCGCVFRVVVFGVTRREYCFHILFCGLKGGPVPGRGSYSARSASADGDGKCQIVVGGK